MTCLGYAVRIGPLDMLSCASWQVPIFAALQGKTWNANLIVHDLDTIL
jgi:hypothetical protein